MRASLAILALLLATSCGKGPYGTANPAVAPTFAAIQANILVPKCARCHSSDESESGFSVSSYQELMASPGAVTPYQPSASQLYKQTLSGDMPRRSNPLSPQELQSLYNWISYGAFNN